MYFSEKLSYLSKDTQLVNFRAQIGAHVCLIVQIVCSYPHITLGCHGTYWGPGDGGSFEYYF